MPWVASPTPLGPAQALPPLSPRAASLAWAENGQTPHGAVPRRGSHFTQDAYEAWWEGEGRLECPGEELGQKLGAGVGSMTGLY